MSEGQLDALAGSDTLRAEVITQVGSAGEHTGRCSGCCTCWLQRPEMAIEAGFSNRLWSQHHSRRPCSFLQGEHRSSDKSLQRASARLLTALTQGESPEQRLAMPLLVLLAQQRKLIVLQSQVGRLAGWVGRAKL